MKFFGWILGMALVFVGSGASAAEAKIGFVNLQQALESTSAGKKAQSTLEKELEAKKKDLEKKESDLRKMGEDMEKKAALWTDEVKNRRRAELQQEIMKFQEEVQSSERDFRRREQELTQPILEKLERAIVEVAKEKKFSMVLNNTDSMRTVLWGDAQVDLTKDVIQAFEKLK